MPASVRSSSSASVTSLQVPERVERERPTDPLEVRALDGLQQLALTGPREAQRRVATGVVEEAPLLLVAATDVAREAPDVGGVGDRLEALELVGVDVAGDEVVGAEDDRHPGGGDASTVGVGVLDVAREAARVVDEQDVERAGLGVADHPREVRPAQGVLARHEVEVLETRWPRDRGAPRSGPARCAGCRARSGRPAPSSIRGHSPPTCAPRGSSGRRSVARARLIASPPSSRLEAPRSGRAGMALPWGW